MHELFAGFGFLGAWLLVAGPLRQAFLELHSEEFERSRIQNLIGFVTDFVTEPTTMPWGNRSLLFRDPDGNLVNFFTPVTPAAIEKFAH